MRLVAEELFSLLACSTATQRAEHNAHERGREHYSAHSYQAGFHRRLTQLQLVWAAT
jgi:hypothetical protein